MRLAPRRRGLALRRQRDRETRGDGRIKAVVRTAGSRTLEFERMHKREISARRRVPAWQRRRAAGAAARALGAWVSNS